MEIGNEGIREIADALKQSTTLRSLSLSYNSVLNSGCEHLAEALRVNSTLETLYLKVAGISDSGAACLFRALESNTSLQHLEYVFHPLSFSLLLTAHLPVIQPLYERCSVVIYLG